MRLSLVFAGLLLATCALAQSGSGGPTPGGPTDATEQAPAAPAAQAPTPPPAKLDGWVITGTLDGYITYNANSPDSNANQLYNFNIIHSQPELAMAKITIDKSDKIVGLHLDVGTGEIFRLMHAGDVAAQEHKGLRYLEQAYVILKPKNFHGTEIDFGQFVTSAGAELTEANTNWNYSRSLLFAWALPYFHFGVRTSTPITKEWTAGVHVMNAWNTMWGNNNMDNLGFTSVYTKPKFTWSANYYTGPNHMGTTKGKRNLFDTTLLLTPTPKANFYINYDYGRDNDPISGHGTWTGIAGAARFQLTKHVAFATRGEFFNDVDGFATGTIQKLKEVTFTGEYKHNDHLISRLEYRFDNSDKPFFDKDAVTGAKKNQNTLTLGVMIILGPFK